MKLLKLSLATALTAGALATTSFATPLEEAIKNVDLSGSAMLRFDRAWQGSKSSDAQNAWKVKGMLNFKTKFDDNFFAVVGLKVEDNNNVQSGQVDLYNGYLGYTNGGTTLMAGRYTLGTFFTDDLWGSGVKVVNSDINGLTLAALWADNLNIHDDDIAFQALAGEIKGNDDAINTYANKHRNLFGVAAIGSFDPVNFQLWYATYEKIANLYAAELGFDFNAGGDSKISLLAQYGGSSLKNELKDTVASLNHMYKMTDGHLYAAQLGFNVSGVDLTGGYVNYTAKDNGYSFVSLEDKGQFITAGEQTENNYQLFDGKNNLWFITAGFGVPDTGFNLGLDYVHNTKKVDGESTDSNEMVARVGYDFSKKLKFSSYYSNYKEKDSSAKHKVRFQVKYSF